MDSIDHIIEEVHHPKFFGILSLIWALLFIYSLFRGQYTASVIFVLLSVICGLFFFHKHIRA